MRAAVIKPDGRRIAFTDDSRGRMTVAREGTNGATDRIYTYDTASNITATEGESDRTTFTYDDRNLMLSADRSRIGFGPRYILNYSYDALGRRTAMNDNALASTFYTYDRADRLVSVTAPSGKTITIDYDYTGRRVAVNHANGLKTTAEFQTPVAAKCSSAPPLSSSGMTSSLADRRRKRLPRHARRARGLLSPEQMAIKNRPDVSNRRYEFGHWEGDLMIFSKGHGHANIATIVERKSRYTVLFRNNDRRCNPIMDRIVSQLSLLPRLAHQSITFNCGFEFVSWRKLYKGIGVASWFRYL